MNGEYAAMMVLYPDFAVGMQRKTEFIVAVDRYVLLDFLVHPLRFTSVHKVLPNTFIARSASMEPSITAVSRCLSLLVDQFRNFQQRQKAKIRFNVVSFGSHFETLFDVSVPVDEESVRQACAYASRLHADYGGIDV